MTYSKAHQNFANRLNSPEALTIPENFLGPNTETVLNFWKWMDSLNEDQWKIVTDRYRNLGYAAWDAAWDAAKDAAWDAAGYVARYAAVDAAGYAAGYAAGNAARDVAGYAAGYAAGWATWELMGMHLLLEQGKSLTFVPMFDSL